METIQSSSQLVRTATSLSFARGVRHTHCVSSGPHKITRKFSKATVSFNTSAESNQTSFPLTKEEALTFLECNLGIPQSQLLSTGNSLNFLNRVVNRMSKSLPFTTINLLTERPLSSLKPEDWTNHIMSGQGGTCRWINPFTKVFLNHLGYNTLQIPGNGPAKDEKYPTHISTIVCDVSYPGSQHLVDCGTRWPFAEAIPLDFDKESPEYTFFHLRSKLFKYDKGILHLCTPASCAQLYGGSVKHLMIDLNGKQWQTRIVYRLSERTEWMEFNEPFKHAHDKLNKPISKPFNSFLFHGFLNDKRVNINCSDRQIHATFVNIHNHTKEKIIMTKMELMDFFVKNYPQYSIKKLAKVCEISNVI